MARPYSQDLPDRVVNSVAGGRTCRATAGLFGVKPALIRLPPDPAASDVGAILLTGVQSFF